MPFLPLRQACVLRYWPEAPNAVGYTSYPNNVVEKFCTLAAKVGLDIFRIFNCFNDVNQMKVCIDAVRATGKVAQMCVCYTWTCNFEIYYIGYYREVVKKCAEAGTRTLASRTWQVCLSQLKRSLWLMQFEVSVTCPSILTRTRHRLRLWRLPLKWLMLELTF